MVGSPVPFHGGDRNPTTHQARSHCATSVCCHSFLTSVPYGSYAISTAPDFVYLEVTSSMICSQCNITRCNITLLPSDGFAHQPR